MSSGVVSLTAIEKRLAAATGFAPSGTEVGAFIGTAPEDIKALLALTRALRDERDAAHAFFRKCWDAARGYGGSLDGGDVQEWAEQFGLLTKVTVSAPCGEDCMCEEYTGSDFPTDCYRPVPLTQVDDGAVLARVTED